jgi:hypothetical protein
METLFIDIPLHPRARLPGPWRPRNVQTTCYEIVIVLRSPRMFAGEQDGVRGRQSGTPADRKYTDIQITKYLDKYIGFDTNISYSRRKST